MMKILTEAMLAALPAKLRPIQQGKWTRAGCPFHGSDNQRSLYISESGIVGCHVCDVKAVTESRDTQRRADWEKTRDRQAARPQAWQRRTETDGFAADHSECIPLPAAMLEQLAEFQRDLPKAEAYLRSRHIPIELVQVLGGGFGRLPGAPGDRLILPHTDPDGLTVSLYGRRIDDGDRKHHHLGGHPAGMFNAPACLAADVWITEGPFDALALLAAGVPNVAAAFGLDVRWEWLRHARRVTLALDADQPGQAAVPKLAKQAQLRDIKVLAVSAAEYGGHKDAGAAWAAGALNLMPVPELVALPAQAAVILPDAAPHGLPATKWLDYRDAVTAFCGEPLKHALAAGWTVPELFALPPDKARPWDGGVLWALAGCRDWRITSEVIAATTPAGVTYSMQRCHLDPAQLGPVLISGL